VLEGLGIAILLAHKNKAPKQLLRSLSATTEAVQVIAANDKLDVFGVEIQGLLKKSENKND
jgi:hypothetical protein